MAVTLDLSRFKSAGIYTAEIDNTVTTEQTTGALRLLVGFANKGIFNRPVYMAEPKDRVKMLGEINTKLEHKGCFFNRMAKTLLNKAPILALNLLKVDETYSGPDQVNYASFSLDAGAPNPVVENPGNSYGEYDYLASSLDNKVYGTEEGEVIPYIGKVPYASLFDRTGFWIPSQDALLQQAAIGLSTGDSDSFENTNFLNAGNISTDEISVLVFKPEGLAGYNITAAEWYNGAENIPFGWIRPSDYMSDYFLTVMVVKGNWTNYPQLSTDNIWSAYFDSKGIKKNMINRFITADGVELLGTFTGSIIPDFEDKQGNAQNLVAKINVDAEKTGLMMSFNEDAAEVLAYDYNGIAEEGEEVGSGCWFIDIDGDSQLNVSKGEYSAKTFLIDMVGHNIQKGFKSANNIAKSNEDNAKIINKELVPSLKERSVIYLPGYESYVHSNADNEFRGNFKAGLITYEYIIKYTANTKQVEIAINCDTKQKNYKAAHQVKNFNLTYEIVRKNQKDSVNGAATCEVNNVDSSTNLDVMTSLTSTALLMFGGDTLTISIKNEAIETAKDPSTNKSDILVPAAARDIVYESPLDVTLSSEFYLNDVAKTPAPYGSYLSLLLDNKGNVKDADIYSLLRKSYTSNRAVTYKDALEESATNVEVHKIGDEYVLTVGTGSTAVKYHLSHLLDNDPVKIYAEFNPTNAEKKLYGANFLSYGYVTDDINDIITRVSNVHYFNDAAKGDDVYPTEKDTYNMFIITDDEMSKKISIGDLVNNKSFRNEYGVAQRYKTIPGLTRITDKVFVNVNANGEFSYNGRLYTYAFPEEMIVSHEFGTQGFYLFTAIDPVEISTSNKIEREYTYVNVGDAETPEIIKIYPIIKNATAEWDAYKDMDGSAADRFASIIGWEDEFGADISTTIVSNKVVGSPKAKVIMVDGLYKVMLELTGDIVTKQIALSDAEVSSTLRFIPLKGLKLSSRHKPGYDAQGNVDIEAGIEKIYSVLEDPGIARGLCGIDMVDYRYVIDSMGYGLSSELGGKKYLSRLAKRRGKTTAILNLPSKRQFATSTNPYFCDTYINGVQIKPPFNTKYIPMGGNDQLYSPRRFSLPSEDNGAKFAAAFWPFLQYTEPNGKKVLVPPAADVANCMMNKFLGGDPYAICANTTGILGDQVTGVEYDADQTDRDYLEPMGVNTIIKDGNDVMIYGNQTCFQKVKSDFNKLHVRENLNTLEIECEKILKAFNFKYNTPVVRATIVTALTPVIQVMQNSGAIENAEIICNESNNTKELIQNSFGLVDISLEVAHGMEKIVQRIYLNKSGASANRQ